ncbi:Hypothetical predicted protein [Mytilus galloprovincialis]|uniref:Uncharacterized protein n=1 Tax=Mytilus galloprovincialis TaxID=29158 RepID=A0A8B6F782_MYTGA|nr:Hypothetical predicted protein [Mytilus galloprovincialis]
MASSLILRAKTTDSHKKVTELVIGDYTLNVEKTLKKKLEATKRLQHVEYKFTNGGVVITSDAATFELFRMAAMRYYETLPPNHEVAHIKKTADSTRLHTVQNTVRVVQPPNKSYTVNIYYTTSRLLVNGKNVSDFIDRDLQNIHNIISSSTSNNTKLDIDDLNRMLREQLTNILNANQMKYEEVNSQNTQDKDSENIACIKCTRNCRTKNEQLDKISLADMNEMEKINPEMYNVERSTTLQSKQDQKETEEINPQLNNIERNTLLQSKQDKTPITTKNAAETAPHAGQPVQNNPQRYMQPSNTANKWNLANSLTGQPLVYRGYQTYSLQQPIDQAGAPFNQGRSNPQMINNTTTEKIIQPTNAHFLDRPGLMNQNI